MLRASKELCLRVSVIFVKCLSSSKQSQSTRPGGSDGRQGSLMGLEHRVGPFLQPPTPFRFDVGQCQFMGKFLVFAR